MQIKENIAAVLKGKMEKLGKSTMEFSQELGIPRSTLQGYLNGTSSPRTDSLEELAEKLGIPPAVLISGSGDADIADRSCLEPILSELQSLHPQAMQIALDALDLLRLAFQASDNLYGFDASAATSENPNDRFRYFLHEMRDPFRKSASYGLLVKERFPSGWASVAVVAPFSQDRTAVTLLARKCTLLQLSPLQILDVVHDFLDQQSLNL